MKYKYTKVSRAFVIFFAALSLVVVTINIIGLTTVPRITFVNLAIILFMFISTLLSSLYLIFGFNRFDLRTHRKVLKEFSKYPTSKMPFVNVFLPTAGEDIKILNRTYRGVSRLDYPKKRISIYVLDDKGGGEVKCLAQKYGFKYFSRPNKGEFKKAGNLKYGYGKSRGEYILILDADFCPKKDMLKEMVPYMINDEGVGIVQTPQDFILNKNEPKFVQTGDLAIQEYFYRICQPGRDSFDAAICTGTNALYRRKALRDSGGFYQIEHSEDSHTGLNIRRYGYKLMYLPLVLATGYCPSNYRQLYKQRSRWCQGSLGMAKSKLFWSTNLSFMSLLSYLSGFIYYLSSFLFLIIPFNTLYILSLPQGDSLGRILYFIPNVIFILISYSIFFYPRFSFSVLGNQLFFYWTYAYTVVNSFIFKKNEPWTPTGTASKKSKSYSRLVAISLTTIFIYWALLARIIFSGSAQFGLSELVLWFWIGFNVLSQISMIIGLLSGSDINYRNIRHILSKQKLYSTNVAE